MEHKTVISGIYFVAISGFESFFDLRNSFQSYVSYVSYVSYFSGIFPRVSSSSTKTYARNNTDNQERLAHTWGLAKRPFSFDWNVKTLIGGQMNHYVEGRESDSLLKWEQFKILPFPANTQKVILTQCAHCPEATLPAWGVDSTGWHHELFFIRELSI